MSGAANHRGKSRQDFATPWEFIAAVERRFGVVTLDLAASWHNAKTRWYLSEAHDSLTWDWLRLSEVFGGWLWLNPPFGNIAPWAKKCAESDAPVLMLVPASVGANWWRDYVHGVACVHCLNGRINFNGKAVFPKDCALVEYGSGLAPDYLVWTWPDEVTPQALLFGEVAA